eukprot:2412239-Prymnesium_polylepis.1
MAKPSLAMRVAPCRSVHHRFTMPATPTEEKTKVRTPLLSSARAGCLCTMSKQVNMPRDSPQVVSTQVTGGTLGVVKQRLNHGCAL